MSEYAVRSNEYLHQIWTNIPSRWAITGYKCALWYRCKTWCTSYANIQFLFLSVILDKLIHVEYIFCAKCNSSFSLTVITLLFPRKKINEILFKNTGVDYFVLVISMLKYRRRMSFYLCAILQFSVLMWCVITGMLRGDTVGAIAYWVGGNDLDTEAGWRWTDGKPFAYFNWNDGNIAVICLTAYFFSHGIKMFDLLVCILQF